MRRLLGLIAMLAGVAMIFSAASRVLSWRSEEREAGESAEQLLTAVMGEIDLHATAAPTSHHLAPVSSAAPTLDSLKPVSSAEPTADAAQAVPQDELLPAAPMPTMPIIELDGERFIGFLELPTLQLRLPVLSEWSYAGLRKAPARYFGSVYDDSLVILAHNYERHFGAIDELDVGTPAQFIDADGNIYRYSVTGCERLSPYEVLRMVGDESDLTLFTCTSDGSKRIALRLERVQAAF